jgi:ABC-2 type transport system ATP-binding protein
MILIEGLSKSYGEKPALVGLDLRVEPGEILGFLGPNGAGKSTTLKILTGLIPPSSGRASIAGFDIVADPVEAKKRFGYVPETPKLYESLTGDAFLDVMGALYHLEPAVSKARRIELFELLGLAAARHQHLREYSKGMRQKVVIAAALIHQPDILLLDEPFDGIDANMTLVMKGLLREMAAQGKTILFSSHILDVVEKVCTRICIIHQGRKVAEGTTDEICRAYRVTSLDEAFGRLTGVEDPERVTSGIVSVATRQ